MNEQVYDELQGTVWIAKRNKRHQAAMESLINDCRCLSIEFVTDDYEEHKDVETCVNYLFLNPDRAAFLGWDCGFGLIEIKFSNDGGLLVSWSDESISLPDAIDRMAGIFKHMTADAGYVTLSGTLPFDSEDFRKCFLGYTLHQFGAVD